MKGLMLHTGGHTVSLDRIAAVKTPQPTKTWFPLPHIRLIEEVKDSLTRTGYTITDEAHALNRNDDNYFGLLTLKEDDSPNITTTLGLRNSHNQQFPAGIAVGSMVFVCDNLSFSGEINLRRKHTRHIERDLPIFIDHGIGRLNDMRFSQNTRVHRYQHTELETKDVDHILMNSIRNRVIPPSRVMDVYNEYREPRHPEFKKDGFTAWRLYNAFTEHMKTGLWTLPKRTQALHALLDALPEPHYNIYDAQPA